MVSGAEARVTVIGDDGIRVQTETLDPEETGEVRAALAKAYGVNESDVTSNFVGASWAATSPPRPFRVCWSSSCWSG